jgi:2-amino-4-hydroxy-6-hydroxymethyldihydropteridine diphosphokinase
MGSRQGENKGSPRKVERAKGRRSEAASTSSVRTGPVLIGLGANLPSPEHGKPRETLEAALAILAARGLRIRARSRWWESAPVPLSDQPWYVNGVVEVETGLRPRALLSLLHEVEAGFGRVRSVPNAPRLLDLDLLAYGDQVSTAPEGPHLPHPRMAGRAFVLRPLAEICPDWRHPVTGRGLTELIAALGPEQIARPLG